MQDSSPGVEITHNQHMFYHPKPYRHCECEVGKFGSKIQRCSVITGRPFVSLHHMKQASMI